jgi:hypothetical protein
LSVQQANFKPASIAKHCHLGTATNAPAHTQVLNAIPTIRSTCILIIIIQQNFIII